MKQLILGNEAVAQGLYEARCSFVSSYPGTPSTEIPESIAKYPEVYAEWAPNEKIAMESAFGASLAGRRSCCGLNHVCLNVDADPLFTISYTGVGGQGSLLASKLLGRLLLEKGYDIKVSEVHGMSQRGAAASSPTSASATRSTPPSSASARSDKEEHL